MCKHYFIYINSNCRQFKLHTPYNRVILIQPDGDWDAAAATQPCMFASHSMSTHVYFTSLKSDQFSSRQSVCCTAHNIFDPTSLNLCFIFFMCASIWIGRRLKCNSYFDLNHQYPVVFFPPYSSSSINAVSVQYKQNAILAGCIYLCCSCCWTVDWVHLGRLMAAQRLWWPSTAFWSSANWRACWTSWSMTCSKHSCPPSPTSGWTEAFRPASDTPLSPGETARQTTLEIFNLEGSSVWVTVCGPFPSTGSIMTRPLMFCCSLPMWVDWDWIWPGQILWCLWSTTGTPWETCRPWTELTELDRYGRVTVFVKPHQYLLMD